MSKYSQVSPDIFQHIVIGAGVVLSAFDTSTGSYSPSNIIGPTDGGINFSDNMAFQDFAEGIDNMPRNVMQMKRINNSERTITASGTFKAATPALIKMLVSAADISGGAIVPRTELQSADFGDLWIVADYSNVNTGSNAGYIAIEMKNVLNSAGFKLQTQNADKGQFAFEFTAHYDLENLDEVPYKVYVSGGSASNTGGSNTGGSNTGDDEPITGNG